ncbi:7-keto-8-aminopelargonate synthetase and related enzyme [Hahella chejuensis KCTC 2396]|uniref:7-keto-8-aminopelargonate synthetase and related enzyme n=1 Tax=Hahella chejuensis (strain KCTC 2396) TaxID=349521 RepID=Q2S9J3_HAHCH|nr:aminotransferase class I/II-fold pyridoxal phosphate-dependent enzyme [Hahella chejuensis]ABB69080.1 putative HBM synthase/aminotransferase [Hahella chejuensis KCTC 2396]ABC32681.1 7-keto-8-aminopelargonate synthetase and related enzyme [Hahella chejuensis KCTC 2396]
MTEQVFADSQQAEASLRELVLSALQRHTEYAREDFDDDADFEGDLGVDSITLASVQAEIYQTLGLQNKSVQAGLDNVGQLLRHIGQRLQKEGLSIATAAQQTAPARRADAQDDALSANVLDVYQAHTGYRRSELDLQADLEGDLGVDSVTQASVLAEIAKLIRVEKTGFPAGLSTIAQVIAYLREIGADADLARPAKEVGAAPAPQAVSRQLAESRGGGMWTDFIDRLNQDEVAEPSDAATELADQFKLSFLASGFGQKDISALHDRLRSEHGMPAHLNLADCDTPEKLLQYIRASRPHQVEALGVEHQDAAYGASAAAENDPRTMKDFVNLPDRDLFHKAREFRKFYVAKQQAQLYWYGMPLESQCRNRAVIYDEVTGRRREFLMFASNNYLGLANHPEVIEAIAEGARRYGATNTGCRLIGGSNVLHKELERRLAKLKGREACIVYPSGYSANLGCISALAGRNDLVFTDSINHMSIQDGCKLSGASRKIYQHSMESLENTLKKYADHDGGKLIVTDGVFSMHGDIVDLPRLVELAQQYGARVLVDDAHSTGVLGKTGSGTTEHFNMKGMADLELGTMSKALAGVGGFVCADEEVVEYLRFYSNSYVFAATIPAAVAAGVIASIDVMEREPQRLSKLWSNIHRLRGHLLGAGFDLEHSNSAIIPVVVGDDRKTLELGRAVRARGMYCQTVVFPGVAVGDARLRISVTSEHTEEDLDMAAQIIIDAAKEVNIPVTL